MDYQFIASSIAENTKPDSGFLYGQTILTTMKVVLRKILFFEDHWARLEAGVDWLWGGESISSYKMTIQNELDKFVRATRLGAIRITFFRVQGKMHWSIHQAKLDRVHLNPLKLKTILHPCHAFMRPNYVKLGSYGEVLRLKSQAEEQGYDDIILKTLSDELLETSFGNLIFLSENDEYIVPAYDTGYLAGITRKHILDALRAGNKNTVERKFLLSELETIKSAWISSSITGIRPISEIDGRSLEVNMNLLELWQGYLEKING